MRVITTHDQAALLQLARTNIHPRAFLHGDDEFWVTSGPTQHNPAFDWRAGYLAADGADAILVDVQNDQDEIACRVPTNVVAVTFVYGATK